MSWGRRKDGHNGIQIPIVDHYIVRQGAERTACNIDRRVKHVVVTPHPRMVTCKKCRRHLPLDIQTPKG